MTPKEGTEQVSKEAILEMHLRGSYEKVKPILPLILAAMNEFAARSVMDYEMAEPQSPNTKLLEALRPLANLDLTGVTGDIVYQRNKSQITTKDVLAAREALADNKGEDQDEKRLYESFVYAKIDDIRFGMWLTENGWTFYDGSDRLINLKANNVVVSIRELFADFKKENPEP